ncbi:hypothetical protein KRONOS_207 [Vibrio phage Kronos]|nr:hypothetical protein DAX_1 [Vibrio phage Dax]QKE61039.1 hypothetical protein DAX_202 [Vibrio phage Dax]QKN84467.1 hypothetical protein BBMUFFIN_1 [Vibrio phage BBMuffin]WBU76807.1 hypothetical protein KRONOS_1 [Vibrio phage Kronos]WBU76990.1 hypothetical protein KRONOS_207 [Vibrio phage Kronos]
MHLLPCNHRICTCRICTQAQEGRPELYTSILPDFYPSRLLAIYPSSRLDFYPSVCPTVNLYSTPFCIKFYRMPSRIKYGTILAY